MRMILTFSARGGFLVGVLGLVPSLGWSQPLPPPAPAPAPTPPDDEPVSEATVVGSSARAMARIPGATTVVSEREMQRMQPMSANEVLRRVPGVYVRDEEGMGLRPNISIRGMDPTRSRRVLILEDGIPISLAPYSEPEMYYNPPVERMGRVEVIRGSGNVLFGPSTVGGVINYVTPAPPLRETFSLRTVAGDRGFFMGQLTYGNRVGNAGFVVSALRRQGEGFRHMGFEVTDLYAKVVLQLGPRQELMFRFGAYNETSASTYLGLTQSMYERDPRQNPVPNDLFAVQRFSAAVAHTWTPNSSLQLRTIAYGYTTSRDWDFQRYDRSPQPNPGLPPEQQETGPRVLYDRIVGDQSTPGGAIFLRDESLSSDRAYQVFGVEPRLRARFRTGPFRHDLDVGGRVLHENSVVRVLLGRGALSRSGELATEQERNGTALAAFVQERFFITERLNLVPGVRVESYFSNIVQRRDQGVDLDRRSNSQLVEVIPGVSASYQWPAVTLFGGMHRGYAPPRILPTINSSARDQLLAAEESVNYEAGARLTVGNWLRAEATGFLMDFTNETVQVSGEDTEFASIGQTRHTGVEAAAQLDFGRALRWPTSVFLGLRYTFVDARVVGDRTYPDGARRAVDGNLVPYAVPHTMMTTVGFETPWGLTAQASWMVVSRHFTDVDNREVPSANGLFGPISSFQTVDFAARYTHRRTGLGVSLTVKNIQGYFTDARGIPNVYIASRSPAGIFPGGFGQTMVGVQWTH
jgi:Fe(3+) dicitrate transport protein